MGICNRCSSFLCKAVNNMNAHASVANAWYHTGFALDVRRGLKGLQVQDFRPHPFLSIFFFCSSKFLLSLCGSAFTLSRHLTVPHSHSLANYYWLSCLFCGWYGFCRRISPLKAWIFLLLFFLVFRGFRKKYDGCANTSPSPAGWRSTIRLFSYYFFYHYALLSPANGICAIVKIGRGPTWDGRLLNEIQSVKWMSLFCSPSQYILCWRGKNIEDCWRVGSLSSSDISSIHSSVKSMMSRVRPIRGQNRWLMQYPRHRLTFVAHFIPSTHCSLFNMISKSHANPGERIAIPTAFRASWKVTFVAMCISSKIHFGQTAATNDISRRAHSATQTDDTSHHIETVSHT